MSEPSDEEMERAERIRKLRSGGARSRGHEMRERRRESRDDARKSDHGEPDEDGVAQDEDGTEPAEGSEAGEAEDRETGTEANEAEDGPGSLAAGGQVDVLEMAATLPEDGSLFVVPIREDLRRQFNKVAEQLHLRYGFQYKSELDAETHVRPLALYLGVQALEDSDVEAVKELLDTVDELAAPGNEDE